MSQPAYWLLLILTITAGIGAACGPSGTPTQTLSPTEAAVSTSVPTMVPLASPTIEFTHGKDKGELTGKASSDLVSLYQEYQTYVNRAGSAQGFEPSNTTLRLIDNLVVVDAVASLDGNVLNSDLEALGLQNSAVVGFLVSGRLPISTIGSLDPLDSLKFVRPAFATSNPK